MLIEILEYIFHWLFSIYGMLFSVILFILCFIFFPCMRIPLLLYTIYIQLYEPSIRELDFWNNIGIKLLSKIPYKKDVYKNTCKAVYDGTPKEELIKPSDTGKGKLLTFHPHGIGSITYTLCKKHDETDLHHVIKNTKVAAHKILFQFPIMREIVQLCGLIPATKEYIMHYLDSGVNVSIFPGGTKESSYCKLENIDEYVYLKNRKGFLEILGNTYENVQIYIFGEQYIYLCDYKSPDIINKIMTKYIGKTVNTHVLNLCSPRNLYKWHKIWAGTSDKTITYIGETHKYTGDVEKDRELYIERLQKLFSTVCEKENVNKKLIIV